jgi:hypothetical protein
MKKESSQKHNQHIKKNNFIHAKTFIGVFYEPLKTSTWEYYVVMLLNTAFC